VEGPRFVEANGVRFGYLEAGTGPLVLLVHGFPDTAYTWDYTLRALAEAGYRAIAPFTRGYAPTAIPADGQYGVDTLGRDVLALIEALGAPVDRADRADGRAKAIVIGHDWGAGAAYSAAALEPDAVRLLVTLAIPHPGAITPTPSIVWALRHFLPLSRRGAADKILRDDLEMIDTLVQRWSPAWHVPPTETDHVKAAFRVPGSLDAALGYYRQQPLVRTPASHRLKITVPTISFAGENDLVAPRVYEKVRHQFTGPYQVLQMPGGHFMHREHPDVFVAELLRALADHLARPARVT
jgi:pimeloyl-ACP methyl ester carboxylesterase